MAAFNCGGKQYVVMRYISRYTLGRRSPWWYVRVPTTPRRAFTDSVYGAKHTSLAAARTYRDRMMKRPSYKKYVKSTRLTPGTIIPRWITIGNWQYLHMQAHIRVHDKLYTKTFSVHKHGKAKATQLAKKALKRMRRELL